MKRAKIVVGSNYGDEGKGSATDYFAHQAINNGEKTLVVLHNGSCQRSHTVCLEDGTRHAFRHFGSGTFAGADTYFSEDFIINPIYFREEYEKLKCMGIKIPKIYANASCRIGLPYDAFINQVIESKRGKNAHGSCGYGVWETVLRNQNPDYRLVLHNLENLKFSLFNLNMRNICKYSYKQLENYEVEYIPEDISNLFCSSGLITRLYEDIQFLLKHVEIINSFYTNNEEEILFNEYDTVIFESGQGLALDEDNFVEYPNFTPSKTGSYNPYRMLRKYDSIDIEVCYVTRSYITRHGAGKLPHECHIEIINSNIEDKTNVYNQFQHHIRYARMNLNELLTRINDDFLMWNGLKHNVKKSIMVTHLNYTSNTFDGYEQIELPITSYLGDFDSIYTSDGLTREYVKQIKKDGKIND